jgi:cobalt/nickel transport protein
MSSRGFFLTGLVVALLIAGVGSYYASGHADGLEYVAEQVGFLDRAEESPAVDGPFAGYSAKGVEDARLGGGLAGVVGSLLVLVVAFGLFRAIRRREVPSEPVEDQG